MNKLITLSLSIALIAGLVSCSKVNPNKTGTNPVYTTPTEPLNPSDPLYPVGRVPLSFTQKVLIEEATGEWCGVCGGTGNPEMNRLVEEYKDVVYGVGFHNNNGSGDPEAFQITGALPSLESIIGNVSGFPSASTNRRYTITTPDLDNVAFDYNSNWAGQVNLASKKTATCGLSLVAAEENDNVNLDVYVGYNSPITSFGTNVGVYLIEDNVPESAPGAQAGNSNAPAQYIHQHVLRKLVTTPSGDAITLDNSTKQFYTKKSYSFNISGLYRKKDNLKIITFITKNSTDVKDMQILNVQQVALDETKKWD